MYLFFMSVLMSKNAAMYAFHCDSTVISHLDISLVRLIAIDL